jgi:hypothetical protein
MEQATKPRVTIERGATKTRIVLLDRLGAVAWRQLWEDLKDWDYVRGGWERRGGEVPASVLDMEVPG